MSAPNRRWRSANSLLDWIIAFKSIKSATLTALGVLLISARQADPVDLVTRAALSVHLPLSSRIFARSMEFAAKLTIRREVALAITAFAYAALMGAEGVSLYLRKPWARWFTIGATSSLLPIELYEIVREVHPIRVLVLVANVAIVVYLWRRRDVFDR